MIIKGNPAGSVKFWSDHLLRDDTNERVDVKEIKGILSEDLPGALREMEAIGRQSRSHGNFMYQANINPLADEHLTPEQWQEAIDLLEKNLGLEGHQRVVVEHVKNGRQHCHIIWNRVDVETLRVVDMGGNWRTHEDTSRELEDRFGLVPGIQRRDERKSAAELHEIRAAERSGIKPADVKTLMTQMWRESSDGPAFAAAIEERGYILARGDRRDFCVIDRAGTAHSLARRLDGVTTAELRAFMVDVARETLPTVSEARETQSQRQDASKELENSSERESNISSSSALGRLGDDVLAMTGQAQIMVDLAGNLADTLCNVADSLLNMRPPPPPEEFTRQSQLQELRANRRASAALDRMRESMERGEGLSTADLQNLTAAQLMAIQHRGDDALRMMIGQNERQRSIERDHVRRQER